MKPSVFRMAISRARSRMDMAMVLAVTSRMVNTTTLEMLLIKGLDVPQHGDEAELERTLGLRLGLGVAVLEHGIHRAR